MNLFANVLVRKILNINDILMAQCELVFRQKAAWTTYLIIL